MGNSAEVETSDPLELFAKLAERDPKQAIMLLFWKARHQNPEFTVNITPEDVKGFTDCVNYLQVEPEVRIYRPQGLPAQASVPAHGNRRAVPGREAKPPKPFVVVQMVDAEGNAIVPIENNEEDLAAGAKAKNLARIRENAPSLHARLMADVRTGNLSTDIITEAANNLLALSKA